MTGNQDRMAAAAAWVDAGRERLMAACDRALDAITNKTLDPKDGIAVGRQIRAISMMAKAMPLVAMMCLPDEMIRAARLGRALKASGLKLDKAAEDDMAEDERDDSPEALQRLRGELEARIARVHDAFERKNGHRPAERGPAARTEPDPV